MERSDYTNQFGAIVPTETEAIRNVDGETEIIRKYANVHQNAPRPRVGVWREQNPLDSLKRFLGAING